MTIVLVFVLIITLHVNAQFMIMTLAERHQFILNRIQQDQYINVVELCKILKVSSVTIRKDLKLLEVIKSSL